MQPIKDIISIPPLKPPKKKIKRLILEGIRLNLNTPDTVPKGGLEFRKYLKQNSKRLKMAKEDVLPTYDKYFKGPFTNEKLYRWAQSNEKAHKRSYLKSIESKQKVFEEAKLKKSQGLSSKDLQIELVNKMREENPAFDKEKVSKSYLSRLMQSFKDINQIFPNIREQEYSEEIDDSQFMETETKRSLKLLSSFPAIDSAFQALLDEITTDHVQ